MYGSKLISKGAFSLYIIFLNAEKVDGVSFGLTDAYGQLH